MLTALRSTSFTSFLCNEHTCWCKWVGMYVCVCTVSILKENFDTFYKTDFVKSRNQMNKLFQVVAKSRYGEFFSQNTIGRHARYCLNIKKNLG